MLAVMLGDLYTAAAAAAAVVMVTSVMVSGSSLIGQ